ncbi:MAG TPA: L-seryl-tRNA(Sec) selenium transferase [Chloroflexia bacterium]|nr:L-seryl-tRNA(Sec) selenium transferase [Chloroflexia bacterium]
MSSISQNGIPELLRNLPSVDRLLREERLLEFVRSEELPHELVLEFARQTLDDARKQIRRGESEPESFKLESLAEKVVEKASRTLESSLREVINTTGVVLHTNLGRALLSHEATEAVARVSQAYNNLEYDLESGERGSRMSHVSDLIARLSGAEAGMVINNNAAAVFMVLSAFAQGKEVILSRGQAVEIGGSFRIPDVMAQSGARLVEVGTTNKTYALDYEAAVTPETAMLMRVHSSNFKVIGFTHSASLEEMSAITRKHGLVLVDDLGSGTFMDTAKYGLSHEPTVQESIAAGADLVTFSGDKLLGGPQAGLIAGKKALIDRLKKHPLARALRVDKMTIAALQVTLLHYLKGEAERKIPIWQMMSRSGDELKAQAESWQQRLRAVWPEAKIVEGLSTVGGGSLPGETIPTWLLALPVNPAEQHSASDYMTFLRQHRPPVVGRVERETLLFDPRTVPPEQEETLLRALETLATSRVSGLKA